MKIATQICIGFEPLRYRCTEALWPLCAP